MPLPLKAMVCRAGPLGSPSASRCFPPFLSTHPSGGNGAETLRRKFCLAGFSPWSLFCRMTAFRNIPPSPSLTGTLVCHSSFLARDARLPPLHPLLRLLFCEDAALAGNTVYSLSTSASPTLGAFGTVLCFPRPRLFFLPYGDRKPRSLPFAVRRTSP